MKIIVAGKPYYTNLNNSELIKKCEKFFSDGCSSYAISFENQEQDIIKEVIIEGMNAYYLRDFNFGKVFIPFHARNEDTARSLLEKGLDLIELL